MKKIYLTALAGLLSAVSYGQCAGGRYSTDVFTNVSVSSGINYGSNTSFTGATTQLDLDVYEPTGDT